MMGQPDVVLSVRYNVVTDLVTFDGSVKEDKRAEFLDEYLRTQVGRGHDDTPPNEDQEIFDIKVGLRVSDDAWFLEHDCGNQGLMVGILLHARKSL